MEEARGHVPTRRDWVPEESGSMGTTVAVHRFACSRCGASAGVVELFGAAEDANVVRSSFTSRLTARVAPEKFEAVRRAIAAGDAAALYAVDLEYAPFFCPQCSASYCGEHWLRWDVFDDDDWHDSVRGLCPERHERMLED
jgi:NMD protein affecting ribosome stability and mRNA decay